MGRKNVAAGGRFLRYGALAVCAIFAIVAVTRNFYWISSQGSPPMARSSSRIPLGYDPIKLQEIEATDLAEEGVPLIEWEEVAECPVPRLDGAAVQIRNLLYVFAGYANIDEVHSHVNIFDLNTNTWIDKFDMPKEMAHSHLGMVTDGRYVYVVTGQYGPQCRGPTNLNFVLDTETRTWDRLPPLPVPRYAPATQLWRGRLHVMGGSKEDRWEPALEHWSLAVKEGKALEEKWSPEIPIPRGGPHRACIVFGDRLFVIGGQEGDFKAKPGSPIFKCSRQREVVYSDVYMLEDAATTWKAMPPMPKPDSHIEFAWVIVNDSIVIVGGTTEKHPVTKKMVLVGDVLQFSLSKLERRGGKLSGKCLTVSRQRWQLTGMDGFISRLANETKASTTLPQKK